jgi:hypothetical protein
LSQDAPLVELARQRARDIISAYSVEDRFQILTNDFEGRDQRLVSKEDALGRIEEIRTSPASRDLSKVLLRQQQCLSTGKQENRISFLISDFQQNISDMTSFRDSLMEVNLVPIRAVQERNISIDSAWFESPVQILNQPSNLYVRISNRSDEQADDVRITLRHDGQTKPVGSVSVPARSNRLDTIPFNILHAGWHEARVSVTDYPVQFDDDYYLSFYVAERVNILSINGNQPNKFITNAFLGARYVNVANADARSLDYSKFSDYQLIILHEIPVISSGLASELKNFAQNGGNVLVFPAQNADLNSLNALLQLFGAGTAGGFEAAQRQASQINTDAFIFRDVYLNKSANLRLPTTQGNYKLPPASGEQMITYRDGTANMARYSAGEGALYVSASPLNEQINDLVRNAEIFVPMLFKMAIAGSKGQQIAHTIGRDETLESRHQVSTRGETIYKLALVDPNTGQQQQNQPENGLAANEFIPEQRIFGSKVLLTPGTQVRDAGWYRLRLQADSTLAEFAYNYDRKESDLTYKSAEELAAGLPSNFKVLNESAEANFGQVVQEQERGIVLWRWCVIFALLFLALEVLLLRFLK